MIDAVILAGGDPKRVDPLARAAGVRSKALISIAGKEMVRYVVEAIGRSTRTGYIVIVGLTGEDNVDFHMPVEYVPARGGMLDNALAGLEHLVAISPAIERVLLSSSDIPLLTTEVVDYFIDACLEGEADIYYSIVEKSVMEARFPGSGRSFRRLHDGAFAGGDLFMISTGIAGSNRDLFRKLIDARKNVWRMIKLLGLTMTLKFMTRRLTIAEAERRVSQALRCRGKAIISPHAELAMDVDKPHQLDIVRATIEGKGT